MMLQENGLPEQRQKEEFAQGMKMRRKEGKGERKGLEKREDSKARGGEGPGCAVGTRADKNLAKLYK